MKYTLLFLFIPFLSSAQVDKEGTSQNGQFDRLISIQSLIGGKFYRGETVKAKGSMGGYYYVSNIPNSLWNSNQADSLFVFPAIDASPDGENGFRASEELDNQTFWVRGGSPDGFSVIANSDIAPDGSRTADRFVYANSSPLRGNTNIAITTGQQYTVSLYIQVPPAASNDDMKVRVELADYSAGRVTISPDIINKGWARYTATLTADADNPAPYVDIDFGATGVEVGDTLILWGLQFEPGTRATDYKRTETTQTTEGVVYLHYLPENGKVVVDHLYNFKNLTDNQVVQKALDYCNSVESVSTVQLIKDRTWTDSITIPVNVHLVGISTGNAIGGTYEKIKTKVYLDLDSPGKTAITFKGEGSDQLTAQGVANIVFIPVSDGNALINTGNTIRATLENIDMSSWVDNVRWFNYGIILGPGSLQNTIKDCSFLHIKRTGIYSASSAIMRINNCRVTEAIHAMEVAAAALYIDGLWAENIDSSAVVFHGNICHINRLYTEDVPKDTTVASKTLNIKKCSVFSVMNSDLQGGQLVADSLQIYIFLDTVRIATIMNNQIQASRINLKTTSSTGYVTWINNVESNNSDKKVIDEIKDGLVHIFDKDKIIMIGSTGQNSFMESDNWIPHIKSNRLIYDPYTATQASALTAIEGMLLYVTDTNGTFTSKGFWGYTGAAWEKLNN